MSNETTRHRPAIVLVAIIFSLYLGSFLLPHSAQAFGRLEDKIQSELDINPFLKKHGIKLRVADATAGYITLEMYDGSDQLRKKIASGIDVMSSQIDRAWGLLSEMPKDVREQVNVLRRTIGFVKEMDDVKQVMLTATLGNPMPLNPKPGAEWIEAETGMVFVWVPGGCFQMGTAASEKAGLFKDLIEVLGKERYEKHKKLNDGYINSEFPRHKVCVGGFWLGKYEVTQGQWQKLMDKNPAYFKKGADFPVEQVSWDECCNFAEKLESATGRKFRLPTEAEWEYAARGGSSDERYAGCKDIDQVAWYRENSENSTHAVGLKAANGFGFFDMSGNVFEWCADWYDEGYYANSPTQNPQGPDNGSDRVGRGGSWGINPFYARPAFRFWYGPAYRNGNLGFRLLSPGRR